MTTRLPRQGRGPAEPSRHPAGSALDVRLRLGSGLAVIHRSGGATQIGSEPGRRTILTGAPLAPQVLDGMDGIRTAGEVIRRTGADPELWAEVLGRLVDDGFLAPTGTAGDADPMLEAERAHLTARYGAGQAEVLLGRRADAVVEVRGSGRVAAAISVTLAAAGVGHVHQRPDRRVRTADLLPPPDFTAAEPATVAGDRRVPRSDQRLLAERIRSVSDQVEVRSVAAHQRPSLVLLAGDGPPDNTEGKILLDADIVHLAAWASPSRAMVGPLVIPRLSSCLWCAELSRSDADPDWPAVRESLAARSPAPGTATAVLAAGAAAVAAGEALDHLEGVRQPRSVDGTIEWTGTDLPRRRSWSRHPDCVCAN